MQITVRTLFQTYPLRFILLLKVSCKGTEQSITLNKLEAWLVWDRVLILCTLKIRMLLISQMSSSPPNTKFYLQHLSLQQINYDLSRTQFTWDSLHTWMRCLNPLWLTLKLRMSKCKISIEWTMKGKKMSRRIRVVNRSAIFIRQRTETHSRWRGGLQMETMLLWLVAHSEDQGTSMKE